MKGLFTALLTILIVTSGSNSFSEQKESSISEKLLSVTESTLSSKPENGTTQKEKMKGHLKLFGVPENILEHDLYSEIYTQVDPRKVMPGTTDVGDVSWIVPTGQFRVTALPVGVGEHTWQAVASTGSTFGKKSVIFAAKVFAATAFDLMTDKAKLDEAKAEFKIATGRGYKPLLTEGVKPTQLHIL